MTDSKPDIRPCPECRAGKHPNCNGTSWSEEIDGNVDCPCGCYEQNIEDVVAEYAADMKNRYKLDPRTAEEILDDEGLKRENE